MKKQTNKKRKKRSKNQRKGRWRVENDKMIKNHN